MAKRKITGILKYGIRSYKNPIRKFQEGGFAAVSKSYDWRDDPYEIMLLEQKSKEEQARLRGVGRGKTTKPDKVPNIGKLPPITGGLAGSNLVANQELKQAYDEYMQAIKTNGYQWIDSLEGQFAHQNLVNLSIQKNDKLKREEENYKDALSTIDKKDRDAYAISSIGNVMIQDAKDPTKIGKAHITQVISNLDKYKILTINEAANWRANKDTSGDSSMENEFFRSGAVDVFSIYDTFIKPHNEQVQFKMFQDRIVDNTNANSGGEQTQLKASQFKSILNNMALGNGRIDTSSATEVENKTTAYIVSAIDTIFEDIMKNTSDQSRLRASLQSEVLKNNTVLDKIQKLATTQEKYTYLDRQVKIALVRKFIDQGYKKSSGESKNSSGAPESIINQTAAKGNLLMAKLSQLADGKAISTYSFGQTIEVASGDKTVKRDAYINLPMVEDAMSSKEMGLEQQIDGEDLTPEQLKQNNLQDNTKVAEISSGDYFTPLGYSINKVFGPEAFKYLIFEYGKNADLVVQPFVNGKPIMNKLPKVNLLKLKSREQYLKDFREELNIPSNITAADLIPNNSTPEKDAAYKAYVATMTLGYDIDIVKKKHAKAMAEGNGIVPKKLSDELTRAKKAFDMISSLDTKVDAILGGRAYMENTMMYSIVGDDDGMSMKEKLDILAKRDGFKQSLIQDANDYQAEQLKKANNIDYNSYNPFNWDSPVSMKLFRVLKTAEEFSLLNEDKMNEAAQLKAYAKEISKYTSNAAFVSNPNIINSLKFLVE